MFANLTVLDNILVGAHVRFKAVRPAWPGPLSSARAGRRAWRSPVRPGKVKAEEARMREEALQILARFGERLLPRKDNPAYSLSYANRRRVEIGRALALGPRLLMLDEPTAGMNQTETTEMQGLIGDLKKTRAHHPADRAQARYGDAALGQGPRDGRRPCRSPTASPPTCATIPR